MSKYGMLGLLEGLGTGMQKTGDAMIKNSLAEAEEQRRLNLERVSRQWRQEDMATERGWRQEERADDREHQAKTTESDRKYTDEREDKLYTRNRTDAISDRDADRKWQLDSRQPSENDKLIKRADAALANGEIDKATHRNIVLGLKSDSDSGMEAKDRAKLRMDAFKQASEEMMGKSPKEIDARADEIYRNAVGQSGQQVEPLHADTMRPVAERAIQAGFTGKPEDIAKLENSLKTQNRSPEEIQQAVSLAIEIANKKTATTEPSSIGGYPLGDITNRALRIVQHNQDYAQAKRELEGLNMPPEAIEQVFAEADRIKKGKADKEAARAKTQKNIGLLGNPNDPEIYRGHYNVPGA